MAERVLDVATYGSLAAKEEDVKTELLAAFLTEGRAFASIGDKTCAVKLWRLCRSAFPNEKEGNSADGKKRTA